jgi:hypothetical protein
MLRWIMATRTDRRVWSRWLQLSLVGATFIAFAPAALNSAEPKPTEQGEASPAVPLHERADYCVNSPDILHVHVRASDSTKQSLLHGINGTKLVDPGCTLKLNERFGLVRADGETCQKIEEAIVAKVAQEVGPVTAHVYVESQYSKVYYIITPGGPGNGDSIHRIPVVTGEQTVSEALNEAKDLGDLTNTRVWIARPTVGTSGVDTILKVDLAAINAGDRNTDHRIQPGDRIFITKAVSLGQILLRMLLQPESIVVRPPTDVGPPQAANFLPLRSL